MLRRRATLLLAIIVAVALLAALPSFAVGRDLASLRIGTPAVRQITPAVASGGEDFFGVWAETTSTTSRIVAGRVTRSGLPLDGTSRSTPHGFYFASELPPLRRRATP